MYYGAHRSSGGSQHTKLKLSDTQVGADYNASPEETVNLTNRFDKLDLLTADKNFARFFEPASNWVCLFDFLHAFYHGSGDVFVNGRYHLFLFHPQASYDYVMHLQLVVDTSEIEIDMISREKRTEQRLDENERQLVADVARTLAYYMIHQVKTTNQNFAKLSTKGSPSF
jgi:hypothetical protein